MRVVLGVNIFTQTAGYHEMMRKEIHTNVIPTPGMLVEDPVWKEAQTPHSITCDFKQECYFLEFNGIPLPTKDDCDREVSLYKNRGWVTIGEFG
ncbi:hypothetical protein [Geomesophilobacter sediminis]|uniref:Uncharacterized protein n=1 Tax=Geomesophilobacter sediminis TaxID=2798584 RepID=A0A8J7JDZ7_9BACT|nr:hypothetical protein [Geomesophilobacter sediminis]MBJ6724044.1 hypothetical protein [Geomesophilobacter sediminis]